MRGLALGLLLALTACNRHGVADVTLDADAAQRNATAAKTLADLAAADAMSRGPAPAVHDASPAPAAAAAVPAPTVSDDMGEAPDPTDESQSNE